MTRGDRLQPWLQIAGLATLAAVVVLLVAKAPVAETEEPATPAAASAPILVELFTSQGCSSCPPADRLLRRLAEESGGEVLPLAFHVDYWNRLGWRDPFSGAAWSERQRRYARALEGGRVYTPQLVVDGRVHVVGSDARAVRRALDAAKGRAPDGRLALAVAPEADALAVRVEAETPAPAELWVAIHESGFETSVDAGENARRTLENDFVVRRLEKLATVAPGAPAVHEARLVLAPAWRRDRLGAVAFLQHPDDLTIGAAAGWIAAESQARIAAIRRVLARDEVLGRRRNHAPETGPLVAAVEAYVEGMDAIDLSACPGDFARAFRRHRDAWRDSIDFFRPHGELRGEMHDLFEELRRRGGRVRAGLERHEEAIWGTWAEVEKSVERHGAG